MRLRLLKDHPHGGSFWYRPDKAKADLYVLKEMGTYWKRIKIRKKDVWLDGGANIGAFVVRLAPQVRRVVAVEATSANSKVLARNLAQNAVANAVRLQGALVGGHPKYVRFVLDEGAGGPGRGSMFRVRGKAVKVKALNVSGVVKKYKINCIKFDIEGAEVQCLEDLQENDLLVLVDQIIMEFHFSMLKDKDRSLFKKVHKILKDNGFKVEGHTVKEAQRLNLWTTLLYAHR